MISDASAQVAFGAQGYEANVGRGGPVELPSDRGGKNTALGRFGAWIVSSIPCMFFFVSLAAW